MSEQLPLLPFTSEELAQIEANSAKLREITDPLYAEWHKLLAPLTQSELVEIYHTLPMYENYTASEHSNTMEEMYGYKPSEEELHESLRLYLSDLLVNSELETSDLLKSD
jgi:hypothetical protein